MEIFTLQTRLSLISKDTRVCCAASAQLSSWSSIPVAYPLLEHVEEKKDATFTCGCTGFPAPEIIWKCCDPRVGMHSCPACEGEQFQREAHDLPDGTLQRNFTLALHNHLQYFSHLLSCTCKNSMHKEVSAPIQLLFHCMLFVVLIFAMNI